MLLAAPELGLVSPMTMSTMVFNHLVLPVLGSHRSLRRFPRRLLPTPWFAAGSLTVASDGFEVTIGEPAMLVRMGILSFAAVTQLTPAAIEELDRGASFCLRLPTRPPEMPSPAEGSASADEKTGIQARRGRNAVA